jgi:hypothetical protein
MTNPILDEIRETREALLAEAGGTLSDLVARIQQDEKTSERVFVAVSSEPTKNATVKIPVIEANPTGENRPTVR